MSHEAPYEPMREPHYLNAPISAFDPKPRNPLYVILDNLRSAFNVGSIFRTGDAGAVERIHLCGMTAHPPNLKLKKTALGALDYVPWTYHSSTTDAIRSLRERGVACIAVEAVDGAELYTAFPWPRPVAIVFGNEVTGIRSNELDLCDGIVKIPMLGYKNTINVATAFGVVMYEILRQWDALRPPNTP